MTAAAQTEHGGPGEAPRGLTIAEVATAAGADVASLQAAARARGWCEPLGLPELATLLADLDHRA